MKIKRWEMFKIIKKVFYQAVREGKTQFIILFVLSIISSFAMYFQLTVPEIATNIAYAFIKNQNIEFMATILPFVKVIIILFGFNITFMIYRMLAVRVTWDLKTQFELGLTKKLSVMTWESYETHDVNMKIEMVRRDGVNAYLALAFDLVTWFINTLFYLAFYVAVISRISILIGLLFLISSIIYIIIGIYCGNKVYKTRRDNDAIYKKRTYLYRCGRSKEAHQDGIANRLYWHLSKRWRQMNDDWSNQSIKAQTRVSVYNLIPGLVFAVIAAGLLYIVVKEIQAGRQEIGYFTLIITTIINFRWTLQSLSMNLSWNENDFNVYRDYLDLMKVEEELPNTEELLPDNFEIEFKNIDYTYPQSKHLALNNLDLKIKAHDVIAIVGVNGSGKTTFVNMLMELSKKYQGDITVNAVNINDTLGMLRNCCSCIFQDFIEYQFTIKENIILGDLTRNITDDEVWEILSVVGLKDFVEKLPAGIDTMLGQINQGTELSKGQWQRLAVARLLANQRAKIWILDEPTAYLDPLGEIEMYNFIYGLKGNRTVIFISHRLGFAKRANRIIVFKDGKVIEDDTHKVLMNNPNSEYAKMYEKQRQWYE
ncbi:MAG: ABC transporter ATP-binding protein [Bacilli bacterium]|nr:ABC transporter ATP-binding protein [Bacilli bacterium]